MAEENCQALLGKSTSVELGLLHVGMQSILNNIMSDNEMILFQSVSNEFANCKISNYTFQPTAI